MTDADEPEDVERSGLPVEVPIEDWIDLHSFRPAEVASVVEEYLYQAQQRGFRLVRIIHGRGIGVQREIVHALLRRHRQVASFRATEDRGATIVELAPGRDSIPGCDPAPH